MRERDKRSDSRSETEQGTTSSSSPSSASPSSSSCTSSEGESISARKHGSSKRKRSVSTSRVRGDTDPSSSASDSSDTDIKRRRSRSRSTRGKERRSRSHRRGKTDREKERKRERRRRGSKGSDEKHGRKEKYRRKDKHDRESRKRKTSEVDTGSPAIKEDDVPAVQFGAKSNLQAVNEAQLQQKEIVRRNVEMAKARLASGELQRMKHEQMEMQRLYGTVDWREKKKLRAEKSRLERTIAAGKKLASIEERENARMDAFRVALGLPTAEAQRQAEWRAEATRALAEAEALNKDNLSPSVSNRVPSRSRKVIGPRLPH